MGLVPTMSSSRVAKVLLSIAVVQVGGLLAGGCDAILGIRDPSLAQGGLGPDGGTQIGVLDASGGGGGVEVDAAPTDSRLSFEPLGLGCVPDPVIDVALARSTPGSVQDRAIVALTNDSLWVCHDPLGIGGGSRHFLDAELAQAMWVGDLTGNGIDDVAVLTDLYIYFFEFTEGGDVQGDSFFGETFAGFNPGWMLGADMTGNGVSDLVIAKTHLVVLENRRLEGWFEDYQLSLPTITAAAFARLGASGLTDLVALAPGDVGDELLVWTATEGAPYYGSPEAHFIEDARDEIVVVADPDGETSFVAVETGEGVAILSRGTGSSALNAPAYMPMDFCGPAVAGDLTGDGVAEIVGMRKSGTGAALIVPASSIDDISDLPLDQPVTSFAIGDVDGDGFPDIIAAGEFGVVILRQLPR
jgi:hypothetical protein